MADRAPLIERKFPTSALVLTAACLVWLLASVASAESRTPVGLWTTVSDVTGEATSTVRITLKNGELLGRIEKLIRKPGEDPNPLCTECPDEKKDQPVQGLTILWGLKNDDDEWNGGFVLDPDDGRTYRSELRVTDDNRKLEVRGYIGFSLFGRTQVWIRHE
jgi:uncharacterized protein (DUF2147 family)